MEDGELVILGVVFIIYNAGPGTIVTVEYDQYRINHADYWASRGWSRISTFTLSESLFCCAFAALAVNSIISKVSTQTAFIDIDIRVPE